MLAKARLKAEKLNKKVSFFNMVVEHMDFDDNSFIESIKNGVVVVNIVNKYLHQHEVEVELSLTKLPCRAA